MKKDNFDFIKTILNRLGNYLHGFNFTGLVFAVIFFCLSLFPSLLPRSWFMQGLVTAVSLAIGYGIGVLISFTIRWMFNRDVLTKRKTNAWYMLYLLGPIFIVIFLLLNETWQFELRELVKVKQPEGIYFIGVIFVAILFGNLFIKLGRQIRKLYNWLLLKINRFIPKRIGIAISFLIVAVLIYSLISGALLSALGWTSGILYNKKNLSTPEGVVEPIEPTRSGSADSYIPWNTLGFQGQKFVGKGPSQTQLKDFNNKDPMQPIRIYAGVNSADNAKSRADLVVKEMQRTNAFKRKIIVVATPTGTGWLNPQSVDSLEYMYAGDSAIVSEQYSYLPSWISFLVDQQKAQETGKELFDAVYNEWLKQPQSTRPKLIVYGLSLGSFGGQSAFNSQTSMLNSVDGALWQGTPGDTKLWKNITKNREPGSPEWQPTINNGDEISFASQNDDIIKNQSEQNKNKILYMQHGSDPIVWFNFNLPLHKPDWLKEQRAPDVLSNTKWVPFITFFQLAADQVVGMNVPKQFGHNYESTVADAWVSIAKPTDWTNEKTTKLQSIINQY